jgi:hypothetical protein
MRITGIIAVRALGNSPVWRLILAFVEIAFHRRGPEQLPSSGFLFALVLAANLGLTFLSVRTLDVVQHPLLMVFVDAAFWLAFVWCVLRAFERERRFRQTASALLGTDAVLSLLGLPLVLWHRALNAPPSEATLPLLLQLLMIVWSIDISAFVLSRALDRMYVLAVVIVVGYLLLSISLRATLFPTATQ